MVIITYNRKEVGNMKYDDAPEGGSPPAEGGDGDSGDKDSGDKPADPA